MCNKSEVTLLRHEFELANFGIELLTNDLHNRWVWNLFKFLMSFSTPVHHTKEHNVYNIYVKSPLMHSTKLVFQVVLGTYSSLKVKQT